MRAHAAKVVLIGAGVINLVTALRLADQGHAVELIDRGPDPRQDRPWQDYGCTRGGANARMFTVTEADQYSGMTVAGGSVFEASPERGGWDVRQDSVRSVHDQDWIRSYNTLPSGMARQYETDIHQLNRSAEHGWERLFATHPELVERVSLNRGILRLYGTREAHGRAMRRHRDIGDLTATYSPEDVRDRFPAFAHSRADALAGGIAVRGFTLGIHRFVATALDLLELAGATLRFETEATGIECDQHGTVVGVRVGSPVGTESTSSEVERADHLVISPGAYGNRLLGDLGLGSRIAGVLGIWHTLPNLGGQAQSVKVSRPGRTAADANITIGDVDGRPSLIVGSGYGFTGMDAANVDPERLRVIQRSVDEMMRDLLPDAYAAAGGPAWLNAQPRYCVRPWTTSSLGLYDVRPTVAGGWCVVTGGHNTGGFTQAPEVADAVLATVRGTSHPMHHLYSTGRVESHGQRLEHA